MSREEESLIAAVCAEPEDDAPRLVYADWLDDNGRPEHAELIRVMVRVERVSDDDPQRRPLVWRARELLSAHENDLRSRLPKKAQEFTCHFRRGFVNRVHGTAARFVKNGAAIARQVPLEEATLHRLGGRVAALAATPALGRLRGLRFDQLGADRALHQGLIDLLDSQHLGRLTRLDLGSAWLRQDGAKKLAGYTQLVKALLTGETAPHCAILVVSAQDGPMPQTRELVGLAGRIGVPHVVAFLSKGDLVEDDWLDLVEVETRQLLQLHGYLGDEAPVIRGNALAAVESCGREGCACIDELVRALDGVPPPERAEDRPFLMAIEDALHAKDATITGCVEAGRVRVGDEVEIVGLGRPPKRVAVAAIKRFVKPLECAVRGAPGSIAAYRRFEALIVFLPAEQGGRATPFISGYRPQFHLRASVGSGAITLPEGVESCLPGDHVQVTVELLPGMAVAMDEGQRFTVCEGGRTIGSGVVTRVLA